MVPTHQPYRAIDSPDGEPSFQANAWRLEWWIFPEATTLDGVNARNDLLKPRGLPIGWPPVNWSFLGWPATTSLQFFSLASPFREELKTTLRKRTHFKGNIKHLFCKLGDKIIPFEAFIVLFPDRTLAIYLRTPKLSLKLSSSELTTLSVHPSLQLSQLRMAIEKICTVLRTANVDARTSEKIKYRWYPYIHIMEYSPKLETTDGTLNIPWAELVAVGTRHTKISSQDRKLIDAYRSKNNSIHGGVLVIDKQSTLVVAEEDYLEFHGIRYCLAVALRMRQVLEREFRSEHQGLSLSTELLDRVKFAYERPSVMTESQTYRTLWPLIARECQVMEWLSNVENKVNLHKSPRLARSDAGNTTPSTINYTTNIYGANRGGIQQGGVGAEQRIEGNSNDEID
jgi:hypothetical protein